MASHSPRRAGSLSVTTKVATFLGSCKYYRNFGVMNNIDNIPAISTAKRKLIASLQQPKHRREHRLFVAEGNKCISEIIDTFNCRMIVATHEWWSGKHIPAPHGAEIYKAVKADMQRISSMSNPPDVIAVMEMPQQPEKVDTSDLILALDDIQDPGNLGTIIRTCDWFGIRAIVCSNNTVDVYNSKVVQSTMGALARVNVIYTDIVSWLKKLPSGMPVYGTFLDGKNIYGVMPPRRGVIVMGNEGKGISAAVGKTVRHRLFIPPYPAGSRHVESLNVSIATAIILSQFRKSN